MQGTIGTLSQGTMRYEDLIPCFTNELERLDIYHVYKDLLAECHTIIKNNVYTEEGLAEILDSLLQALQDFSPAYCYFGPHVGDGVDYGYWPDQTSIYEAVHDGELLSVSDLSEVPDDWKDGVVVVNDHGNMTMYQAKTTFESVWAIV